MIDTPKPVIFDCVVDKAENCFPMIPSGKAHNEMILGDAARATSARSSTPRASSWCDDRHGSDTLISAALGERGEPFQ